MDVVERIQEIEGDVEAMLVEGAHEELAAYASCYALDAYRLSLLCGRLKEALTAAKERATKEKEDAAREAGENFDSLYAAHNLLTREKEELTRALQEARSLAPPARLPLYRLLRRSLDRAEVEAHEAEGARWLKIEHGGAVSLVTLYETTPLEKTGESIWIPLGRNGLPLPPRTEP